MVFARERHLIQVCQWFSESQLHKDQIYSCGFPLPCGFIVASGTPVKIIGHTSIEPIESGQGWMSNSQPDTERSRSAVGNLTKHEVPALYRSNRRSITSSNNWVTSASSSVILSLTGFLFWFFFLDPQSFKKKEPRLFFRPQGYLKNSSRSWRALLFASFFFGRKSCGAFKKLIQFIFT